MKKPRPDIHPPCPKCGAPMTLSGTIGLAWKHCKACGFREERKTT